MHLVGEGGILCPKEYKMAEHVTPNTGQMKLTSVHYSQPGAGEHCVPHRAMYELHLGAE